MRIALFLFGSAVWTLTVAAGELILPVQYTGDMAACEQMAPLSLRTLEGWREPVRPTAVRIGYGPDALRVSVFATEPYPGKTRTDHGEEFWRDDSIELFVLNSELKGRHFAVAERLPDRIFQEEATAQ